jgi:regulator of sigma E protease
MTIVLFLVVLAVLIFVHELGHFLVAKRSGIRVDEFAVGFPPKIFSWVRGETKYSLNLIPFGGYVKIFGENPDIESISGPDSARSFVNAKKTRQIAVLAAGVAFNIIFAWVLISTSFMFGSLVPVGENSSAQYSQYIKENQVILTGILKDSPAEGVGLKEGDRLLEIVSQDRVYGSITDSSLNVSLVRQAIQESQDNKITLLFERGGEIQTVNIFPELDQQNERRVIGIYMENVALVKLGFLTAFWEGAKLTVTTTRDVSVGLLNFITQSLRGDADLSQVSGPVGIVGLVGDAADFGLAYFLGFVAFISLNLAVINMVPFPALDGGRILFVIIETIIRRPISSKVANTINATGFLILILLMVFVTYRDIIKLF